MLQHDEIHAIGMRQDAVIRIIESSVADILFLANLNELSPFLRDQSHVTKVPLEQELMAFSRNREIYHQIRVLSLDGMELLRVNYVDGLVEAVPTEDLQDKADRYYFQDLAVCPRNSIYVSPLDLNVENGSVENPLNPVMRFALPIGDEENRGGYLLLNLKGAVLLDAFANTHADPTTRPLLADQDGDLTYGFSSESGWDFMLPGNQGHNLSVAFPDEWRRIISVGAGQFESPNGLFTFRPLVPYEAAGVALCEIVGGEPVTQLIETLAHDIWVNVSWVPAPVLGSVRLSGALQLAGWNAFGVLPVRDGIVVLCTLVGKARRGTPSDKAGQNIARINSSTIHVKGGLPSTA